MPLLSLEVSRFGLLLPIRWRIVAYANKRIIFSPMVTPNNPLRPTAEPLFQIRKNWKTEISN